MWYKKIKINLAEGAVITTTAAEQMEKDYGGDSWIYSMTDLKADGFWEPMEKNIMHAEELVLQSLVDGIDHPENLVTHIDPEPAMENTSRAIREILKNYFNYYRQYIGLIINKERYIYFNSFPSEEFEESSLTENPASSWIMVDDGGHYFWQILACIDRNRCSALTINGEA